MKRPAWKPASHRRACPTSRRWLLYANIPQNFNFHASVGSDELGDDRAVIVLYPPFRAFLCADIRLSCRPFRLAVCASRIPHPVRARRQAFSSSAACCCSLGSNPLKTASRACAPLSAARRCSFTCFICMCCCCCKPPSSRSSARRTAPVSASTTCGWYGYAPHS